MSGHDHGQQDGPDHGARSPREGVDPEVLEFAQMLFQLARAREEGVVLLHRLDERGREIRRPQERSARRRRGYVAVALG